MSTAPFYSVNGGTIKNLTVDGTIKATSSGAAGLIAQSKGTTTIENCQFIGKLLAIGDNIGWVDYCGGFVGNNKGTLTITNSLYAPPNIETGEIEVGSTLNENHLATFARNDTNGTSSITNSYYTRTLGEAQGTLAHKVSAGEGITLTLDDTSTTGLIYDGTIYAGQNEAVILNVTAPNGYVLGNVTASAGTLTPSDGKYSLTMPESDVVITATSEPETYTITYDLKGGSLPQDVSNPERYTVASEAITLNNPVRAGYNFAGWTGTDLNEATANVTINQGATGNRNYTANWIANTYTVQFNANNGTGDEMEAQSFTYGADNTALSVNTYTRTGYDFAGWNTQADGNGTNYTDGQEVQNLTTTNNGTVTLYAKWTAHIYTISYNLDDGALPEGQTNPATYTIESDAITLNNTEKEGYTFAGWSGTEIEDGTMTVEIPHGSTGIR